jgi:hypothetical protein
VADSRNDGLTIEETAKQFEEVLTRAEEEQGAPAKTLRVELPVAEVPPVEEHPEAHQPVEELPEEPAPPREDHPRASERPTERADEVVTIPRVEYEELQRGTLRQQDYTRKTQAHAERERQLDATLGEYRTAVSQLRAKMEEIQRTFTEPDWKEIEKRATPEEYRQARSDWDAWKTKVETVRTKELEAYRGQLEEAQRQHQNYLVAERQKLLDKLPEWKDPANARAGVDELVAFAESRGFTRDEVLNVQDHRALLMLRDLMLAESRQRAASTPLVTKKPPVVRSPRTVAPGAARSEPRPKPAKERAFERLMQTGRTEDAAKYFLESGAAD